ncbi:hypothetical protein GCM10020358_78560 [Amorphoplanes nipponensis]|uniref:Uncharacterized protein n=1 Tax=Actinoplanes nipponensis TaxID=135950 RepID=A0A919JL33_9ACTN|nr:hypothetical protein Ani05nite_63320 [Actinoplanes nipponensis]
MLRRTRLPLVVSLFLAALLGAPTAAGPAGDPLPAPVTAAAAAAPAAAAVPPLVVEETDAEPTVAAPAPARPVRPAATVLTDQISTAATAPRGPPATA